MCKSEELSQKNNCQKNGICRDLSYDSVFSGSFVNYEKEILTAERFFEDPEKYPVYDQTLGQERYYLVKGGIYFPKGSSFLEIIAGVDGNKIYIMKWDDVGRLPKSEQ